MNKHISLYGFIISKFEFCKKIKKVNIKISVRNIFHEVITVIAFELISTRFMAKLVKSSDTLQSVAANHSYQLQEIEILIFSVSRRIAVDSLFYDSV